MTGVQTCALPIYGHEFEQTLGDSEGQRSLACCSPWGHRELDRTERLNSKTKRVNTQIWPDVEERQESAREFQAPLNSKQEPASKLGILMLSRVVTLALLREGWQEAGSAGFQT